MGNENDNIVVDPQVEDLKKSDEFKDYYETVPTNVYGRFAMKVAQNGMSPEKFAKFLTDNRKKAKVEIKKYLKGRDFDISEMRIPSFSRKEMEKREKISKAAEIYYMQGTVDKENTCKIIDIAVQRDELTKEERDELLRNRDDLFTLFKLGSSEEIARQNLSTAKYVLGKDLDKSKLSEDEIKDIKEKRYAEVVNNKMAELLDFDFEKFKHLSDEELVKNWPVYHEAMHVVSIVKANVDSIKKTNKYINDNLFQRVMEIERSDSNMQYLADTGRIQAIASPYYSMLETDFLSGISMDDIPYLDAEDNPEFQKFYKGVDSATIGITSLLSENALTYFSEKLEGVQAEDINYFSPENGSPVDKFKALSIARQQGAIIISPKDHPELAKVFSYDAKTYKLNPADELQEKYSIAMNAAKATMTNLDEAQHREDQKVLDACKALRKRNETVKTASELSSSIADDILNSADPDMTRAAVLNYNRRNITVHQPKMSYAKFAKALGIKQEDRIPKSVMKERRQLSRDAFESMLDFEIAKKSGAAFTDEVKQMIKDSGMNVSAFTAVMCSAGKDNLEANTQMVRDFFGYGSDNEKLDISPDELSKKRCELIQARLNNLAEQRKTIGNNLTDAEISSRYSDIAEIGDSFGKSWKNFAKNLDEKLSVKLPEEVTKQAENELEQAVLIGQEYGSRMDYIASEYYQYGGEKELGSEKGTVVSIGSKDHALRVTGLAMNRHATQSSMAVCSNVLKSIDLSPEDIDFVYDDKGKGYEANRSSLGEAFKNSGNIMVFKKGQTNPVMLNIGDLKKQPVEVAIAEPREADLAYAKMVRYDMRLSRIQNDYSLSENQRNIQTAMVENEYELGIIAGSAKGLTGEKLELYKDSLKNSLASYIARATADRYLNENPEVSEKVADEKQIANYAKQIKSTASLGKLVDSMLEGNAFENINPDKIINGYVKQQKDSGEIAIQPFNAERKLESEAPKKDADQIENPNLGAISMGPK